MKAVITVIIILILLIIGVSVYRSAASRTASLYSTTTGTVASSSSATATSTGQAREFTITGKSFSYDPNTIRVNQGDTVTIHFVNADSSNVPHNLTVSGYNKATQTVSRGASTTLQFVADKTGSFEYYCSVDSHRAQGMKGTLIVQ